MRRFHLSLAAMLATAGLALCNSAAAAQEMHRALPMGEPPVVEIVAEDYAFDAPDEIRSGWTTLRFVNEGEETHFVILHRLPEGKTFDDYVVDVGEPFNDVWYPLRDGEIDKAQAGAMLGEAIPQWFWSVRQMGGPGLVQPGATAEATLKLEPGNYVIECFMKTEEGEFHGTEGMARPLTVRDESTGAAPPAANVQLTLSNDGIDIVGELTRGRHTVAVHFAEHPEGFGNDVHLVRLEPGTTADQLVRWMDWMNVEGLQNPAPFTFLGGTHEMPVGYTAFVTVDLEPGRYAWVAEMMDVQGKVREFTVRR